MGGIEEEAARTFKRWIAGRRVIDVIGPKGIELSSVATGHTTSIDAPIEGVQAKQREVAPLVELRVPFTVRRDDIDNVARGSKDSDWQAVKDAAVAIAKAEDSIIFNGYGDAGIEGIIPTSSNEALTINDDIERLPQAVSNALAQLQLEGIDGPYALLLPADMWEDVHEETDDGYPVIKHIERIVNDSVIWAPAIDCAVLLSLRGGDYELHLGRDLSIGYLSHDAETVTLYLEETLTALQYTEEASVTIRSH